MTKEETIRAWMRDCEDHIESGVSTNLVAVCPTALRSASRELLDLRITVAALRRDLADPPADIQELVLKKLGLWPPPKPHEPSREQRLERLLKAVQTDAGNWLHSDLQKAITGEVGEPGEYRGLDDSGLSENREARR